jgi:hypothetical protein
MNKTKKPTGYVIYKGPSQLTGEPIVVIALTGSTNRKTGDMVQTYILADNGERPTTNQKTGADEAICGDCKHRPANGGACYVVTAQGPTVVYKSYLAGKYPETGLFSNPAAKECEGRMVRLGTYGDPAAVPAIVWFRLLRHAKGNTGYTHQWNNPKLDKLDIDFLKSKCMASVDNPQELKAAQNDNWRTFRVRLETEALQKRESMCPASDEAGKKLKCETCGLCNGAATNRKGSIAIINHGYTKTRYIAQRATA